MAEIKSSIEIAMERTKNLILDREEKKALEEKELREKEAAILRRYMREIIDKEGFLKEFEEIKAERTKKESFLFDIFLDEYDISSRDERLLQIFDILKGDIFERFKKELEGFQKRCEEELEKRKMIVKARIEDRLRDMGISGDGFQPNLDAFEEWQNEKREVLDIFKNRLKALKKDLEKSL